ncbi:hypothetical protein EVAR_68051_1 [Eumeta japonica]|uniref:Uncharacterized protein n=1 Tax=Eumeta variegata TaxID=151549 RepID=A0A4C1T8N8_EUMVA|nr:hypothetical protein EVAR_68051_1 [Eumeta japonica]
MRTEHQVQNLRTKLGKSNKYKLFQKPKIVNESQVKLDVFKSLPVFDGNINSYRIWREDVTRMMETISDLSGQPIYAQALQIVVPEGKFTKTFGNEQRHQHQQRYQPQPRTELRPRPPLNNFQPRTQQYQSPRYNNHQPPPEPMDTSSGNTAYGQPTTTPSITNHGKEEESQVGITEIINK